MEWRERARRDAFDAVVVEVYEPVQRYLRRRCRDEDLDEVLNDVLLVLWRRIDDTPPGRALPWAYGISRHCLDNHRRGGRRRLRLADRLRSAAEPRPKVDWTSPEECALQEALDRLPERDREVLRLWAWERLEPREIAEVLGVTPTAVAPADRKRWIVAAAAAAVAIAIGGAVIVGTGEDDTVTDAGPALELDLGESNSMMSCLALSAEVLADMPVAFAGTATEVDDDAVTLAVDHWYVGGDATSVVLHAPAGMQALIDGFEFAEGTEYLVSATEGTVNFCGYSGPTTPELQTVYDEAFGS